MFLDERQSATTKSAIRANIWFIPDVTFHVIYHSKLVKRMIGTKYTRIVKRPISSRQTLTKFAMKDEVFERVGHFRRAMATHQVDFWKRTQIKL